MTLDTCYLDPLQVGVGEGEPNRFLPFTSLAVKLADNFLDPGGWLFPVCLIPVKSYSAQYNVDGHEDLLNEEWCSFLT